jgi:hypothetical protein
MSKNNDQDIMDNSFNSLHEVVSHLDAAGFRISKSKIYRDKEKGFIRVNPENGSVPETEVRAYAASLDRKDGDIGDMSDIHAKKTAKEVEKLEEQIKKARFEREKEEGLYIPKKDFEAELSARAVVLESGLKHQYNMKVREWIAIVSGRPEKAADLLQQMNESLDHQMTEFANTGRYQVMFGEEGAN